MLRLLRLTPPLLGLTLRHRAGQRLLVPVAPVDRLAPVDVPLAPALLELMRPIDVPLVPTLLELMRRATNTKHLIANHALTNMPNGIVLVALRLKVVPEIVPSATILDVDVGFQIRVETRKGHHNVLRRIPTYDVQLASIRWKKIPPIILT